MMGWSWDAGAWVGMGVGMLVWLVVVVVVVWLIVRGLIALERPRTEAPASPSRTRFSGSGSPGVRSTPRSSSGG